MLIISKFKDYYDYMAKTGVDKTIVYRRLPKENYSEGYRPLGLINQASMITLNTHQHPEFKLPCQLSVKGTPIRTYDWEAPSKWLLPPELQGNYTHCTKCAFGWCGKLHAAIVLYNPSQPNCTKMILASDPEIQAYATICQPPPVVELPDSLWKNLGVGAYFCMAHNQTRYNSGCTLVYDFKLAELGVDKVIPAQEA